MLRTRLREDAPSKGRVRKSLLRVCGEVWREGGVRRFWAGLPVHLARQVPNGAIVLTTYEYILAVLARRAHAQRQQSSGGGGAGGAALSLSTAHAAGADRGSPLGPVAVEGVSGLNASGAADGVKGGGLGKGQTDQQTRSPITSLHTQADS